MKRVLVLGAGLVSRPLVRHFLELADCRVLVASLAASEAERVTLGHPQSEVHELDVNDSRALEALVARADLVFSLVPYALHVQVARVAIERGVHVVTTSYVSPEMRELDEAARRAGVAILNEIGLDPGLDHMSALRLIRRVERGGRRVVRFRSCCGVVPAEPATNPWGYKFSWSPRGVLLAARQGARFIEDGRVVDVAPGELFHHGRALPLARLGEFEIYPNRDSLQYLEAYGLAEPREMLRATLRHPGWAETLRALTRVGLLDLEPRSWPAGSTYRDLLGALVPAGPAALEARLARQLEIEQGHPVIARLAWAGLLSDQPLASPPAARVASPLDLLVEQLQRRLVYGEGERDMVVLQHEVSTVSEAGEESHGSRLVAYGEPGGDSATARTVSLPAAVAGQLLLEGRLAGRGVLIPTSADLYEPVLARLESTGIRFEEWSEPA